MWGGSHLIMTTIQLFWFQSVSNSLEGKWIIVLGFLGDSEFSRLNTLSLLLFCFLAFSPSTPQHNTCFHPTCTNYTRHNRQIWSLLLMMNKTYKYLFGTILILRCARGPTNLPWVDCSSLVGQYPKGNVLSYWSTSVDSTVLRASSLCVKVWKKGWQDWLD